MGGPPAQGFDEPLSNLRREKYHVTKHSTRPRIRNELLVQTKQRKRDMKFGTSNIRSLYRSGSFTTASRELARYKLDLVGAQEVRWDKGDKVRARDYNFFYGKGNEKLSIGNRGFVHHRIVSAVKRV